MNALEPRTVFTSMSSTHADQRDEYKLCKLSRGAAKLPPTETNISCSHQSLFSPSEGMAHEETEVQRSSNLAEVTSIHLLNQH